MSAVGMKDTLTRQLGRISAPARETRNMLAVQADAILGRLGPCGAVYWVGGTWGAPLLVGDDNYDGCSINTPKATIKEALALCTDYQNDVVFVDPRYWQPTDEDWPIVVDKYNVHIIGLGQGHFSSPAIHPDVDKPAFVLGSQGQYGSLQRLTVGGGTTQGGILLIGSTLVPPASGQVDGTLIKECVFGHQWFGTPKNAIYQPADANRGGFGIRIEKCRFLGDLANCSGKISGNAIDLLGGVTYTASILYDLEIVDNMFMGCQVGVNLAKSFNGRILNNKFICEDSTDGDAIRLLAACRGNMVDGNVAMAGGDAAMAKNPYCDVAATDKNHWGLNFKTQTAGALATLLPKQSL